MQLVVSRMLNRSAYSAFNVWLDLVEENSRKRQMLAWTLGRISRLSASAAFEAWRDMVEARKADAATEQERWQAGIRKAERFMLAWMKKDVSTAFIRWRSHTVVCKRQRRVVSRCVSRMTRRSVASSLNRWSLATATLRRQRLIVRRALERMQRRTLASAFVEWRRVTDGSLNWTEKLSAVGQYIGALKHREMFRAFNRWREAARKLKEDGVKVARCIQKMTRYACATVFLEWASLLLESKRARRVIAKFVGAMRHRDLFKAFSRWRTAARKRKVDAVKVSRCLHKMLRHHAAVAFGAWARFAELQLLEKRMERESVERLDLQAAAMKTEMEGAESLAVTAAARVTAATHAKSVCMTHFSKWRATRIARVASSTGARVAFRAVTRTRRRAAAFRAWKKQSIVTNRARVAVTRWQSRLESKAMTRWILHTRQRKVGRRAAVRWQMKHVATVFRTWRFAAVRQIARRVTQAASAAVAFAERERIEKAAFAEREQIEKSAFAERERIEKSRIASFAANALYERRSRTFLVKLISRWRSLVVDARRRVGRLGDEMRSVLQKRRKYLLRFPKPKSSDGCFPTRD